MGKARVTRYARILNSESELDSFLEDATLGKLLGLYRYAILEPGKSSGQTGSEPEGPAVDTNKSGQETGQEIRERLRDSIIDELMNRRYRVDHREHHAMIHYLSDLGFEVVHLPTGSGDISSERVSIERKEDDLLPSLFDDRRLRQLGAMREDAEFSYLLVTKSYREIKLGLRERQVSERVFLSFIASLCAIGYPPLFIDDKYDASLLMKKVIDKIEDDKPRVYVPRPNSPTKNEYRNALFEGLPSVGPKMRRKLTKVYPTVSSLCKATVEDLMEIEGIGKRTAERIVEVLS